MTFVELSGTVSRTWRSGATRITRNARALSAAGALWLLKLLRRSDPDRAAQLAGTFLRIIGPFLPEHRVGRANLAAAFPDKPAKEIERILSGVWENLGRLGAEFVHLDRLWEGGPEQLRFDRVDLDEQFTRVCLRLRDDGKPALIFAAHLANWELAALAATAVGAEAAVVYRPPNRRGMGEAVFPHRPRALQWIATGRSAPVQVVKALKRGAHVGMLVDQHFGNGVDVMFFGRRCKANPLLARLAQRFDCPIHGVRVIRLPAGRFRLQMTEALQAPRDSLGRVDIPGTMQAITSVIEGWVREHPEQWLWLHRRWR